MANHQPIPMVTLGRPFHLGMLYDIRSDKIITGTTLWDPQNLANNTSIYKQPFTGFEIIAEDSLQTKAHALGVEASLKLSLLGGLINIAGSAKYAHDYQKTNKEARLTLKYSTTTHFEQLTMKHLGKGNLNHPDLHDANLATHVVTGVLYGAEAYFVFDRSLSDSESKKEVSGMLKVMIDKIPTFGIEADAKLSLTDKEKNFADKLDCKFYGDFRLNENPSTFNEAVRIYRRLPSLLGDKSENVVPKKVWLYPLHLLDNKAMRIVRDISANLIDYSISVIEKLRAFEVRAVDLSKSAILTHFTFVQKQLRDFSERLSEFQRDLKEKIVVYLPQLRGNTGVEESVLFNFFKEVDSSPFNPRKLESWLTEKRKEIALITTLVANFVKDKNLNIMIESPNQVIGDITYDYIFFLSLRFIERNDPQLTDMHTYRYDKSNYNSSNNNENRTKWFDDPHTIGKIRKNLRQFIEFARANNVPNGQISFMIYEDYSVDDVKSTELILFDDGVQKNGFIIPSKPNAPYMKSVTDNSVKLGWTDAANGTENVTQYKIMYRQYSAERSVYKNDSEKEENEDEWTEVYTDTNDRVLTIFHLPAKTTFVFKVQSVTAIGLSPISDISKPIQTLSKKELIGKVEHLQFFYNEFLFRAVLVQFSFLGVRAIT